MLLHVTDGNDETDAAVATYTQKERKQGGTGESGLMAVTDGDNAADDAVAAPAQKECVILHTMT